MTSTLPPRLAVPVLPLSLATPGETVEVIDIRLPADERQRLYDLGLTPGAIVRVISSDPAGGMAGDHRTGGHRAGGLIVAVRRDARLALNRSTAHKIFVSLKGPQ